MNKKIFLFLFLVFASVLRERQFLEQKVMMQIGTNQIQSREIVRAVNKKVKKKHREYSSDRYLLLSNKNYKNL